MLARLSAAAALLALATACPPKATTEALPPAGLAGAPQAAAPGAAAGSGAPLTLPGAGHAVAPPSGAGPSQGGLPAGHPPIPSGPAAGAPGAAPGAPLSPALTGATQPPGAGEDNVLISGTILETLEVPEYTYMRLKTAAGEEWVAVNKTQVKVGDQVTVNQSLVMTDFPSRSLNRTFPKLVMGMLVKK
jgi:hypothetical protein